jgi:hypothetical protein
VWVVTCVWAIAFSIFFFLNYSCLIKLGPYEIEAFSITYFFLWLEALNFDDKFFLGLIKKILGLKFFKFFFGGP